MPQPWDGFHLEDRAGFDQRASRVGRDEVDPGEATAQGVGSSARNLERALGQRLVATAYLLPGVEVRRGLDHGGRSCGQDRAEVVARLLDAEEAVEIDHERLEPGRCAERNA